MAVIFTQADILDENKVGDSYTGEWEGWLKTLGYARAVRPGKDITNQSVVPLKDDPTVPENRDDLDEPVGLSQYLVDTAQTPNATDTAVEDGSSGGVENKGAIEHQGLGEAQGAGQGESQAKGEIENKGAGDDTPADEAPDETGEADKGA